VDYASGTLPEAKAGKRAYFASREFAGWPKPEDIERYFLAPPEERWFFETKNSSASFTIADVDGTSQDDGYDETELEMWGHPEHGVLLIWSQRGAVPGASFSLTYTSKGDLSRLRETAIVNHNDPMPIGLFVPYEAAWKAVKEFIENDGAQPKSIEWIANVDLPADTFPDP
jgi:hypothetical protein